MRLEPLPFRSTLAQYRQQAQALLDSWQADDAPAIQIFRNNYPPFLDEKITWLPKQLSDAEVRGAKIELADAELTLARWYSFQSWKDLAAWVEAVLEKDSPVARYESAVEAIITGDVSTLRRLLSANPELISARSTYVTPHDPPVHAATLLHYLGANGVEGYRQKTPPNAVEIARILLDAGAEPDALAQMYGGHCTTMSMLVSSNHPAKAGLQIPLIDILVDYGAAVEGRGTGAWTDPVMTALVFGYFDAAAALVRRGARVDSLPKAAGLGRLEDTMRLLTDASSADRHRAFALAAQLGQLEIVRLLLDTGEDPNRYNPENLHSHSTPMHQAVAANHLPVVELLVERGARLDINDTLWHGTPLGWAEYCDRPEIAGWLRSRSAPA
jgi:hypothetical protein